MRLSTTLAFALTVGLIALFGTAPALLAQQTGEIEQDTESLISQDITIEPAMGAGVMGAQMQAFDVTFEANAYIPERTYAGAMVVKVQSGTLAFRVQSEVLVDPQDGDLPLLEATPSIPLGANPNEGAVDGGKSREFTSIGSVPDCPGMAPHVLCLIGPAVLGENFVQLEEGDLVYLPDNSTCFFCNTTELDAQAKLLVWAGGGFSWYQQYLAERRVAAASPVAQAQGTRTTMSWMLNPGSRCH